MTTDRNNVEELLEKLKEVWGKAQITEEDYQKIAEKGEVNSELLDMLENLVKEKSEYSDQVKEYIDRISKEI